MTDNLQLITQYSPIVSIGDLVADLIVSIPHLPAEAGRHQIAGELRLEPGGGANFLIAGARLGYPMAAIGALGDDDWGHQVATMTRAEGVDLLGVTVSGATTAVIVLVGQSGGHVFLGKYGHGSKIELARLHVNLVKNAGAVYCAGYTLCEERLVALAMDSIRLAKKSGIPVCFDPGPQMSAVSDDLRRQLLPLIDTLFITEEELPLMMPGGSIDEIMAGGPTTVVVKRGPQGCLVFAQGQPNPIVKASGYPVVVVDTAAAGDSFNAAFMVGSLWGWSVETCAKLANAVGAAKVQKLGGGRNVPTLTEVQAVIDQFLIDLLPFPDTRN